MAFEIPVEIPMEELDDISKQALKEIEKQNYSSALQLLERTKSKSKYVLFSKGFCVFQISQKETSHKIIDYGNLYTNKFSHGIFDSEAFEGIIHTCQDGESKHEKAIEILENALKIDPNFMEAKKLLDIVKETLRQMIKTNRELLEKLSKTLKENLVLLNPREFEKFIAYLFNKIGFRTEITPYVSDYGADIVAERGENRIVVQVKKYIGQNVGAQEVQQSLGSMWRYKANKAILVTTTDFTAQALEQAKGAPIELWNQKTLHQIIETTFFKRYSI